jgi:hypothetical protein
MKRLENILGLETRSTSSPKTAPPDVGDVLELFQSIATSSGRPLSARGEAGMSGCTLDVRDEGLLGAGVAEDLVSAIPTETLAPAAPLPVATS